MKLTNRNRFIITLESITMAFVVFLIYFLPGISTPCVNSVESSSVKYNNEQLSIKPDVAQLVPLKQLVFTDLTISVKDNNKNQSDSYKLHFDNNRIQHFISYNKQKLLEIIPDHFRQFYYFYHLPSLEEPSILS